MELLLVRYRNLTVLVLTVAAQLLLLAYQVKTNEDVRLLRVWAVSVVTPITKAVEVMRRNTLGFVEDYLVLVNVRGQNRSLSQEVGKLKLENQYLRTELSTADRFQALQAFQSRTPSRMVPARVIGSGTTANSMVVFVDVGSQSGVQRGMAVITPDGIAGKVLQVYPTASQVLLITDPSFAAGVISVKNRVQGTVKGLGHSKCRIEYVQNEEKVDVGEMFYTSGDDRVFPKGLPVGTVRVVREGKLFKDITLSPAGLQNGIDEVLIVIEGVHQALPDVEAVTSSDVYVLPAPPANKPAPDAAQTADAAQATDADRLREQYKRIGEAQGHLYGEGRSSPNFNAKVERPTPPAAVPAAGTGAPASAAPARPAAPGLAPTPSASVTAGSTRPVTPRATGPGGTPSAIAPPANRPAGPPAAVPRTAPGTATASQPAAPAGRLPVPAAKPRPAPSTADVAPATPRPAAAKPAAPNRQPEVGSTATRPLGTPSVARPKPNAMVPAPSAAENPPQL